jgi:uncharacterized protein (DUF1499 family)
VSARLAGALAVGAIVVLAASGPATRAGLVAFNIGLLMLALAGLLGLGAALFAVVTLVRGTQILKPVLALLAGIAVALVPAVGYVVARQMPLINDISTDPAEQSEAQRRTYADVQPLHLPVAPNIAFERAKGAIEEAGWEIVREDPSAGRIDAVATSFWFGFKDDVSVRIAADGPGSRVHVRSKSRVGKGDLGTNAHRIRSYQKRLQ